MNYIDQLFADSKFIEVRYFSPELKKRVCISGIFDNPGALWTAVNALPDIGNLYCTLNEPRLDNLTKTVGNKTVPVLLTDSMLNRIDYDVPAFGNENIKRYTRFIFDFDPVRAEGFKGCMATTEEMALAEVRCRDFVRYMRLMGLPEPLIAFSGNGWHVQYRCNVPVTPEFLKMRDVIYKGLNEKFNDSQVEFDTSVKNEARIFRLYGTVNRKGASTHNRPHREAYHQPIARFVQMRPYHFEKLFERFKPAPVVIPPRVEKSPGKFSGRGDYDTLDVVKWFSSHGLYEHHIVDNKHAVICPWESEHSDSTYNDTIIFDDGLSGWGGFACKHSHCQDRNLQHVMRLFGDADNFCQEVA